MSPFRYRDNDSSTGSTIASVLLGALAGFAVGMFVAQRTGGLGGLTSRLRKRAPAGAGRPFRFDAEDYDEIEDEESDLEGAGMTAASDSDADFNGMDDDGVPLLEERVLEAFNNDPVLAERAVDIGSVGDGAIELAGWVDSDDEAEHAVTLARGVPGVATVVNRLLVTDEERQISDNLRRVRQGDSALTESRWEGQQVGTGKRRQGTSDEIDRHADAKPVLEDKWLGEREAIRHSAEDLDEITAERRRGAGRKAARPPRADEAEPKA